MPSPSTTASSVVESVFHRLVSRRARVREVESMGDFRLVTLAGEELEGRRWSPGDMIQIGFAGFVGRAYTPVSFDPRAGTSAFLGYVHGGAGVASRWLESLKIGEELFLVGPRSALKLDAVARPLIFFGDETSFGTVAALRATQEGMRDVVSFFEVDSEGASRLALERIGVTNGLTLTTRTPGERHLEPVEEALVHAIRVAPSVRCVFTGKASSIQRLYKAVRRAGLSPKQVTNVAYWAPGRKGFSGVQR